MTLEAFNEMAQFVRVVPTTGTFNHCRAYDITGKEVACGDWPVVRGRAQQREDEICDEIDAGAA